MNASVLVYGYNIMQKFYCCLLQPLLHCQEFANSFACLEENVEWYGSFAQYLLRMNLFSCKSHVINLHAAMA